jgi:hypothetical protein
MFEGLFCSNETNLGKHGVERKEGHGSTLKYISLTENPGG